MLLGSGPWPDGISAVTAGPGIGGRDVAGGCRGGQVGAGAFLGLAAACNGRADSFERRLLWRPCRCTWGRSCSCGSARCLDISTALCVVIVDARLIDRGTRVSGRRRSDGHQGGPVVCVAVAGGNHRGRDRPGIPVCGARSPAGACLPADAPVREGAEPLAGLPHDRKCDRHAVAPHAIRFGIAFTTRHDLGWLYRVALERGYLDGHVLRYVVVPFVRTFRWCDALERRWTDFLAGEASRESDQVKPHFGTIEEFS